MSEASGATGLRAQGRVGTVINGKWQIEARIGAGGMSTVYAAVNRSGTRAALKMLNLQLSREEGVVTRFLREGYLANSVAHPGVCQVLDDGYTEDGCAYLVLELLEGETMESRRLRMGGAMPLDEVLDVADQALATIAAAHEKGIVHRDVKPENVFLTNAGHVKLLDFGLARLRDASIEATATGITIGTPEFMPPEQALGKSDLVDARSDVWGVGATIFTALSGNYVHEASNLHEQLVASATRRARSVLTVVPELPRAIAQVVDKALELERGDRWPSAGDMQRALRQARGMPLPNFGGPASVTLRTDVPASSAPISSDRTIAMSSPAPSSDGPTLESAVQPRPPIPNPRQTERLTTGLLGVSQTVHLAHPPYASSHPRVSAPPHQHLSSGSMPSAPPAPPQVNLASSNSYPFVQLPPREPAPERRGALVASAILLLAVVAVTVYLYFHGTPHLP